MANIMAKENHGIVTNKGRRQPYTVWFRGEVIAFTDSYADAASILSSEERRKKRIRK